jgi:hypothetical protein
VHRIFANDCYLYIFHLDFLKFSFCDYIIPPIPRFVKRKYTISTKNLSANLKEFKTRFPSRIPDGVRLLPSGKWRDAVRFPISRPAGCFRDRFPPPRDDVFLHTVCSIIMAQNKKFQLNRVSVP